MRSSSLNDRIRQDIETRIMSGAWEPGHRIPPEHELMESYACSRMTVSKALSALADRGLIERRKRAGSFVAAPTSHRALIHIPDIAAEIQAQGNRHTVDIIDRQQRDATAEDCRSLMIEGGPVLSLDVVHRADGQPFAIEHRLLNLTLAPTALDVDFAVESPGRWLLGHVPWTDARHRITAIAASASQAATLGLKRQASCLSLERWTWRNVERITYVRQIYPGDHALIANFAA